MDARHNEARPGRVLMATGRDAADVAITTSFGNADLRHFYVESNEANEDGTIIPPQRAEIPVGAAPIAIRADSTDSDSGHGLSV